MADNDSPIYRSPEDEVVELRRLVKESLIHVKKLHWKTKSTVEARRCVEYLERAKKTLQLT